MESHQRAHNRWRACPAREDEVVILPPCTAQLAFGNDHFSMGLECFDDIPKDRAGAARALGLAVLELQNRSFRHQLVLGLLPAAHFLARLRDILSRMNSCVRIAALAVAFAATPLSAQKTAARLDAATAGRFAALALACVQKEYPNKIAHVLNSPNDVKPPHELTPAFYGCFDWHSSVHGHWLLAKLVREFPQAPFATDAMTALKSNITPAHIAGEVAYIEGPGRESFERPYGLAWLLQLAAELRDSQTADATALSLALAPLESAVVAQLESWLPKLAYPIREGEHAQTAFAFGLILDYARGTDSVLARVVTRKIREFYLKDRDCPINYEPSGQDFLSPCIAEADVVRRVVPPAEFAAWLTKFLPQIPTNGSGVWLRIGIVTDKTDGKLAHLDGLNLSRAWMLQGIAAGLPANDRRIRALLSAADIHAASGLAAVTGEHYAGGHWLGSFATYLVTRRGIGSRASRASVH